MSKIYNVKIDGLPKEETPIIVYDFGRKEFNFICRSNKIVEGWNSSTGGKTYYEKNSHNYINIDFEEYQYIEEDKFNTKKDMFYVYQIVSTTSNGDVHAWIKDTKEEYYVSKEKAMERLLELKKDINKVITNRFRGGNKLIGIYISNHTTDKIVYSTMPLYTFTMKTTYGEYDKNSFSGLNFYMECEDCLRIKKYDFETKTTTYLKGNENAC